MSHDREAILKKWGHLFRVDNDVNFVLHTVDLEVLVSVAQIPHERTILQADEEHLVTTWKDEGSPVSGLSSTSKVVT